MKSDTTTITHKCVDVDAICAHSFQGQCTTKKYKYLCAKMKEHLEKEELSYILGN